MVKVTLDGTVLAESDNTVIVEGNHYFPPESINKDVFTNSNTSSTCPWKGKAAYYNAEIGGGSKVKDVAWYYPHPSDKAKHITNYVAFYKNKVEFS